MRKNAEKMDLSSCNRLLQVPMGFHGFWAHDLLPDLSHDLEGDPQRVTISLAFTSTCRIRCCYSKELKLCLMACLFESVEFYQYLHV